MLLLYSSCFCRPVHDDGKMLSRIAARYRPEWILSLARISADIPVMNAFTRLYDPNRIRHRTSTNLDTQYRVLDLGNCRLRVDLNDHIGYWMFIRRKPFEQAVYHLAKEIGLSTGDAILDIGANIGSASIPACAELDCELIAVEASFQNFYILRENIEINSVKASAHHVAVTDVAKGIVPLFIRPGNQGANTLLDRWSPSKVSLAPEMVETVSLDQLLGDDDIQRIKLVKIDVEGAELDVLKGAKRFLECNNAPILMEYRIDAVGRFLGSGLEEVLSLMSSYKVEAFEGGVRSTFVPDRPYESILFTKTAM